MAAAPVGAAVFFSVFCGLLWDFCWILLASCWIFAGFCWLLADFFLVFAGFGVNFPGDQRFQSELGTNSGKSDSYTKDCMQSFEKIKKTSIDYQKTVILT